MRKMLLLFVFSVCLLPEEFIFIKKTEGTKAFFFIDEKTGWIIKNDVDREINLLTDSKLLYTEDGGKNWKVLIEWSSPYDDDGGKKSKAFQIPYGMEELGNLFFFNKKKGFVLSNRNIYKTENGGKSWIYEYDYEKRLQGIYHNIYFINEEKGFLCGAKASIAMTEDGGKTWEEKSFTDDSYIYLLKIFFIDANSGFVIGKSEFTGGSSIILRTNDGGKNWIADTVEEIEDIHPFGGLNDIFFFDTLEGFIVTERGDVYKTIDGMKTFNLITIDEEFYGESIIFIDKNNGFVCGYKYDLGTGEENGFVYKTKDGGNKWERIFKTKEPIRKIQYIKDKNIIIFGGDSGIYIYKIK